MDNKEPNTPASEPVAPGLTEFDVGGIRNGSAELAKDLIVDAAECVAAILKQKKRYPVTENPRLVAVHVLAALLDYELGRIVPILERGCNALEQIAESVDFIAARPDGDDAELVLTTHQREAIYRTLEADYMARGNSPSIEEMDTALRSFKKFAGL